MLSMVGADVVGMSLVPDVLGAVHAGLRVGAIAVVSNLAAGLSPEALTHEDVQRVVGGAAARLGDLVAEVVNEC
jgi:purine nucleoside phosphorylase